MNQPAHKSQSIRHRLLVTLLSVVALSWLATALMVYRDSGHEIEELFDAQLAQSARVLLAMSTHELAEQQAYQNQKGRSRTIEPALIPYADIPNPGAVGDGHEYEHKLALQIWTQDNQLALHTSNAPDQPLSDQLSGFSDHLIDDEVWRVFSLTDTDSGLRIQVAQSHDIRHELIDAISGRLLTPVLLSLPVLALLIWYGISHAMRPLVQLANNVSNLEPGQLSPLPLAEIPDESRPLVESLNQLFAQLQHAFDNERRFTADAAHELRTPLAALKIQAQVALGASDDAARQHALQRIVQGVDRATHLVEQLLTLARLDPDDSQHNKPQDSTHLSLSSLSRDTLAELAVDAQKKNIELILEADDEGPIIGSPNAIYILLRNLIDNAIRYTPDGGSVCVKVIRENNTDETGNHATQLTVSDSGPGIPAEQRSQVLERFYRGETGQATGSGLGLSIVQRIVEHHHATMTLGNAEPGGLEVHIRFPALDNHQE